MCAEKHNQYNVQKIFLCVHTSYVRVHDDVLLVRFSLCVVSTWNYDVRTNEILTKKIKVQVRKGEMKMDHKKVYSAGKTIVIGMLAAGLYFASLYNLGCVTTFAVCLTWVVTK